MGFFSDLFGLSGGKRKTHRAKKAKRGGGDAGASVCESGEACAAQFSADSSLSQGESFAKMTAAYHGGKRTRGNRKHKMRGGAADLSQAFEQMPAEMHQQAGTAVLDQAIAELSKFTPAPQTGGSRRNNRRQRGGQAPLGDAFQAPNAELHKEAGTSVLDAAFAQLGKFIPNHNGGSLRNRKTRRRRGGALGSSPVDAPGMLLRSEDYQAAFLNPQWEQENLVNPNFHGPNSAYIAATGGRRKSYRKGRKATKSRKGRKATKSRKGSRKSRKH
jgi:hypothetical protein